MYLLADSIAIYIIPQTVLDFASSCFMSFFYYIPRVPVVPKISSLYAMRIQIYPSLRSIFIVITVPFQMII